MTRELRTLIAHLKRVLSIVKDNSTESRDIAAYECLKAMPEILRELEKADEQLKLNNEL